MGKTGVAGFCNYADFQLFEAFPSGAGFGMGIGCAYENVGFG